MTRTRERGLNSGVPANETFKHRLALASNCARARAAVGAALFSIAFHAHAQNYPGKTVRIVVPFPAGGSTDVLARMSAEHLNKLHGQLFIVDNRPGAGNQVALELLSGATPDGYTLMTTSLTPVIHPMLYKGRFDLLRDFAHPNAR